MVLERGALINHRYRIVEILGQGGMGSVYRAVDENLGVEVAVKDNLFTTDEYARQFRREAIILANLRHPNLPRVTDHFVMEGQGQYLVMDYIEGEDLRQRMDRVGVLPDEEVITIGAAVCDALTYLGTRRPAIIHRDIKPGNVKITPQGQIFLVDFGLAKTLHGSQATTTGARAMTPGYSPPEQYGTARTDQRSDIFSLGATLYAALTGAIPEDALARAMEQVELTPIRKHNQRVARRLANVIEKALAVRPDDRYQTAEDFKHALQGARSATRRRPQVEMVVEPAPEMAGKPLLGDQPYLSPQVAAMMPRSSPSPAAGGGRSPSLLPTSLPLDEVELDRPRSRPRRSSGRSYWLFIVFAVVLVGGMAAYRFQPGLLAPALARLITTTRPTLDNPGGAADIGSPTPNSTATTQPTPEPTEIVAPVVPASPTVAPPTETTVPTATPQPTPVGGGGGQIAFASDANGTNQVYVLNVDGTGLRQITDNPDGACQPSWSPDGLQIVFISPCRGNFEDYYGSAMFVINVDGSGLRPLQTVAGGGDYDPAWSPDGKRIVFTSLRANRRPQLYVYSLEDNTVTPISENFFHDQMPAWSQDGRKIIFITNRHGAAQVWVMNADGSDPEQFSHSQTLINSYPNWSPDGKVVLFTQLVAQRGIPRLIVAAYPAGEKYVENRLSQTNDLPMREGRFSPDGMWIAVEGWPAGAKHDIYIMAANGAAPVVLTDSTHNSFDPAWNPAVK